MVGVVDVRVVVEPVHQGVGFFWVLGLKLGLGWVVILIVFELDEIMRRLFVLFGGEEADLIGWFGVVGGCFACCVMLMSLFGFVVIGGCCFSCI